MRQSPDPRRRKVTYPLVNIVTIAVCGVICGADDFVAIATLGQSRRDWLATMLDLSAGIPSHDRFNAIFQALDPAAFEKCLLHWQLAVTFGEDACRVRKGLAGANLSVIRLAALGMLENGTSRKIGIKNRRLADACDTLVTMKLRIYS